MDPQIPSMNDELLKTLAAGVITATTTGTAIDLGAGVTFPLGGMPMNAPLVATAVKTSAGDETYVYTVQDSPDNVTFTTRGTATIAAAGTQLLGVFVQQRYVRAVLTLGGTAPSITIADTYINPIVLG